MLLLVAVMLVMPAASASPWAQTSHDAARTGHLPGAGPTTNDTAFVARLPGAPSGAFLGPPEPAIVDGAAYVPVEPTPFEDGLDGQGVARVDLATGAVGLLVEMEEPPQHLAVWNETLLAPRDGGLDAYDRRTGEQRWSTDHVQMGAEGGQTFCAAPAVAQGEVLLACTELEFPAQDGPPRTYSFVWSVDAGTGERNWIFGLDPANADTQEGLTTTVEDPQGTVSTTRASQVQFTPGVTVLGSAVLVLVANVQDAGFSCPGPDEAEVCYDVEEMQVHLWAIDRASPHVMWTNRTDPARTSRAWTPATGWEGVDDPDLPLAARVTGTSRVVYAELESTIEARAVSDGELLWQEPLGEQDLDGNTGGMSSALVDGSLYATSAQTLHRIDVDVPVNTWSWALDPASGEEFGWGSVIVAQTNVYTMTRGPSYDYSALYAVDADTGEQVWRQRLDPIDPKYENYENCCFNAFSYAVGEGIVVALGSDATVHVIGQTEASLTPELATSTNYPALGENVTADLSGTQAGAFGNASRYKAIWGDGSTTGWTSEPTLNHTYTQQGNHTARFIVGNEANQTASTTTTFHAGYPPPQEPNVLQQAFAPKNQDLTFGILGLVVAVTGGAIGVVRRKRKQAALQEELETLEQGFEDTRGNPGECEAFLETRKARARSLMMDGDLTEEQFGVVESRIEELGRELRTSVLDDRFQFLPHGMVESLKKMLADGEITAWEREAFETLLEDDETLSETQKERVRGQLDRWFTQDASSG